MGIPWTCRIDYALRLTQAELVGLLGEQRIRTALIKLCEREAGKNHQRNRFLDLASRLRDGAVFDLENLPGDIEAKEVYSQAVQSCGLQLVTDYTVADPCHVSARGGIELHNYNSVRGGKVLAWKNDEELGEACGKMELDQKIEQLGWPVIPKFIVYHDCA
jgi:hypothetical protein